MRAAPKVTLTDEDRRTLVRWSRGRSTPARLVRRAQIVLQAAEGRTNVEIAAKLGIDRTVVNRWRRRFAEQGLAGIEKDAPRPGRPATQRAACVRRIIEKTTREKPAHATHWTTRTLARELGVSQSMVHRVWKAHGLKPHLTRTFKLSRDPHFIGKMMDIVGLYLNPPEHALVLSVDEKSQIQALDRTQPCLPLKRGRCRTFTPDYVRHGTTTLFAAMEIAGGKLIARCMPRHRHQEWIRFLEIIDAETPADVDLHLIVDNYITHKHSKVRAWLQRHPRFHIHFTPTGSSWLNLIERWFRDLSDKRLRRGSFQSVRQLVRAITDYIEHHNRQPRPFVWTARAGDILDKIQRAHAVLDKMRSE